GLLASLGIAEVTVHRRPRVAFLSVGDELCALGRPLGPGEVYDSNRYTLFGALSELGVEVLDMGALRNDPEALERALREAGDNADVIITTAGGASADDSGNGFDLRSVLAKVGQVEHWTLDLKPGRPLAFGRVGRAWLFGLPGNPVAVMVSFYQFVIDGLLRLMGVDPIPVRPIFRVPTVDGISRETGRREYRRGILAVEDGEWRVRLAGNRGSGVLRSMSEANCFIVLDAQQASVAAGELVAVQMFEGLF
ncbi:MAG TPA: molybdopterin molybdotransferase MoeA, partial [Rhodocyclaceae bacterium]|nr:molybdopterin molybdotransferase MoeA [Rhodocyclaceae bacterium]